LNNSDFDECSVRRVNHEFMPSNYEKKFTHLILQYPVTINSDVHFCCVCQIETYKFNAGLTIRLLRQLPSAPEKFGPQFFLALSNVKFTPLCSITFNHRE